MHENRKEEKMENAKISNLYDLNETIAKEYLEQFTYPWEALKGISEFIKKLGPTLDPEKFEKRGEDIWVAKSAKVAPTACLNGPLIIDEEAEVRHCAFVRGSAIVGKGSVVGNSTELKNDIIFNSVQVPHYNYVGDSILGYKSHMGAGSITSNVKSDKTLVVVKDKTTGEEIETDSAITIGFSINASVDGTAINLHLLIFGLLLSVLSTTIAA